MRSTWYLQSLVFLLLVSGCAGTSDAIRFARGEQVMCKHCNCLMPADLDPETMCPVCDCKLKAHQCVRGR